MKTPAAGALSIAASAALQFSGLGGPVPTILAALTAAGLAIYLLWCLAVDETGTIVVPGLGEKCQRVGNALVVFARRRMSESPGQAGTQAHATDTSLMYAVNYADEVTALLRELVRNGCMGAEEANAWMVPDDVQAIELLGRRLLQLGLAAD
jgi:hypothetical protein